MFAILTSTFVIRAVIVGTLVSLCASLLGVSLVLKRYSMIGDGLSHVGFGSLSVAMALNLIPALGFNINPLQISIPIVLIAAFLLLRVSENSKIQGDAAIALISSSALAFGVIITALSKGMNLDVMSYMFGSILVMTPDDVRLSVCLSVIVIILFLVFYKQIFLVTFDENFGTATGTNTKAYKMLIATLTALTIVIGMRIMGTLLISSLIIFPALTSMRIFKSFSKVVISSAVISVICFFLGILISIQFKIPTGASVVAANIIMFSIFSFAGFFLGHAK